MSNSQSNKAEATRSEVTRAGDAPTDMSNSSRVCLLQENARLKYLVLL
ncbi:MAG: hypothetical protein WBS19_14095 [Candidatus Korobacteraceae bacterium]